MSNVLVPFLILAGYRSVCLLDYILSYLHLLQSYCECLKMAETMLVLNIVLMEVVPDSDPDSSDIEVSLVGCNVVSSYHTDLGMSRMIMDNTINNVTVSANENIPNKTSNFTDITIGTFAQDSGPSLPENFDVSVATALDYFSLLFKVEYLVI